MKKLIITLMFLAFTNPSLADSLDYFAYEAQGQLYFITADDILAELKNNEHDTCLEYVINTKGENISVITKFYDLLLSQCRQKIASISGIIKEHGNILQQLVTTPAIGMNKLSQEGLIPASIETEYEGCIWTLEELQKILENVDYNQNVSYPHTIKADINECINNVQISKNVDRCPTNPTVESADIIQGITNLNTTYKKKKFTFSEKPNVKQNQMLVFNGTVMIACDNNKPVHIIKPAFSGYEECREAKYQAYPNVGSTPNGVYLLKHDQVQETTDKQSWGDYRIPLIPAKETNTFGRTNMYLHGTSNKDKRRSGGCVSLGVAINDFIESDWFQNKANDLLLIVHTPN